jgi:hypothetical protein
MNQGSRIKPGTLSNRFASASNFIGFTDFTLSEAIIISKDTNGCVEKVAADFLPRFFSLKQSNCSAPKGQDMTAQCNALGSEPKNSASSNGAK